MSNHVAAGIVTTLPPAPPLNLALVAVVMHVNGSAAALSASWTDAPNHGGQTWKVFDYSGHVIATKNVSSDSTGDYSILAAFPTPKKFPVTFQVCDRSTCKDRSVSPN